jgi:hypothetical protein
MAAGSTAAVCVCVGSVALACGVDQVTTCEILDLDIEASNADDEDGAYTLNIADCRAAVDSDDEITFRWELGQEPDTGDNYGLKLQRGGDGQCNRNAPDRDNEGADCEVLVSNGDLSSTTVSYGTSIRDVLGIQSGDDCFNLGGTQIDFRMSLIVPDATSTDTDDTFVESPIVITVDVQRPASPTISEVSAGGSTIEVKWDDLGDDDLTYRVYYDASELAGGSEPELLSGVRSTNEVSGSSTVIDDGVTEGVNYWVAVVSVDSIGNESLLSDTLTALTAPTTDFFEAYRDAGGVEQGGYCAAAPRSAGLGTLLFIGAAIVASRRRREDA